MSESTSNDEVRATDKGGLSIALEEMRRLYAERNASFDSLDAKATSALGATSLVIGLVSTLQLTTLDGSRTSLYWVGLALVGAVYAGIVILTIRVLMPREIKTPIKAEWQTLHDELISQPETEALRTMVKAYKDAGNNLKEVVASKGRLVRWVYALFGVEVVALILLGAFAA